MDPIRGRPAAKNFRQRICAEGFLRLGRQHADVDLRKNLRELCFAVRAMIVDSRILEAVEVHFIRDSVEMEFGDIRGEQGPGVEAGIESPDGIEIAQHRESNLRSRLAGKLREYTSPVRDHLYVQVGIQIPHQIGSSLAGRYDRSRLLQAGVGQRAARR